jgi:hypothetical protein
MPNFSNVILSSVFWEIMQKERCFWLSLVLMLKSFIFVDEWVENQEVLLFWQVKPVVHVFQVNCITNGI